MLISIAIPTNTDPEYKKKLYQVYGAISHFYQIQKPDRLGASNEMITDYLRKKKAIYPEDELVRMLKFLKQYGVIYDCDNCWYPVY